MRQYVWVLLASFFDFETYSARPDGRSGESPVGQLDKRKKSQRRTQTLLVGVAICSERKRQVLAVVLFSFL